MYPASHQTSTGPFGTGMCSRLATSGCCMRFKIGLDGLKYRPLGPGDSAVGIVSEEEKSSLLSPDGFHRRHLEAAKKAGAKIGLIFFGRDEALKEIADFVAHWNPDCVSVLVPVPKTDFLLEGVTRVTVKTFLNTLSTCTMVRLGRVMGNYMIWVVPSNLKLIDRSTRYIQKLTGLEYERANHLLFEVIEHVEPRMKADQAYPPVVGVSVMPTAPDFSIDKRRLGESKKIQAALLLRFEKGTNGGRIQCAGNPPIEIFRSIIRQVKGLYPPFRPGGEQIAEAPHHVRVSEMRTCGTEVNAPESTALVESQISLHGQRRSNFAPPIRIPIGPGRKHERNVTCDQRRLRP